MALESLLVDSERVNIFHCYLTLLLVSSMQRIRQFVILELSSILPSCAYFESECLEEFVLSYLNLLVLELVLVEIQRIRDRRSPIPVVEYKFVAEAHQFN